MGSTALGRRTGGNSLKKRIAGSKERPSRPASGISSNGRNGKKPSSNGRGASGASNGRRTALKSNRLRLGGNGAAQIEAAKPTPKSSLKPAELEYFKGLLLKKRAELLGDVDTMEREALRKNRTDASGDLSQMPIHMADIGTDNYEQEFTIGLIATERTTLKEIDEAMQRIVDGTYGICLGTHQPIPKARLRAKPWARYCVEYKRAQEENGMRKRMSAF